MPTILITGANRGIGFEFVRQYLADGAQVIACCRAPEKAEALRVLAKTNPALRVEALDVTAPAAIKSLAEKFKDTPIDILINNAGVYSGSSAKVDTRTGDMSQSFGTIDAAAWSKVFLINSIAPLLAVEAFTPHLSQGKNPKIINISSRMGSMTYIRSSASKDALAYRSSKAALNAAMCAIVPDLNTRNITIVNFHPGWVRTDMGSSAADLSVEESVTGMRGVIATLTLKDSGQFIGYNGKVISW